ncbi:alpha-L-rhamnosidase C-terminal domain-containing protein [Streptomyces griseorubiginosus]
MWSEWRRRDDGRVALAVTVPRNTEAEIWVPTHRVYRAWAGSYRFDDR